MKRLTTYRADGRAAIANNENATPKQKVLKIPKVIDRLAAYEDTGLEPEDIVALTRHPDFAIADYYKSLGLTMERITELAQADKEGRVRIEEKTYQCPKCGAYRLTPRLDNQYYFCFKCKTQFTKEQAEAALRREQG